MFGWNQKVTFKQIFDKYFIVNIPKWNEKNEQECKNTHKEVLSTIKKKFPSKNFLLLNFSSIQYATLDFNGIMIDFEQESFENLPFLYKVCYLIHGHMKKHEDSLLFVQVPNRPEYCALILSCYLLFNGEIKDCMEIHDKFSEYIESSNYLPSITRYSKYFGMILYMPIPNMKTLELCYLKVKGLQQNFRIPQFVIKQNDKIVYKIGGINKPFIENSMLVYKCENVVLLGDFEIYCYPGNIGAQIFRFTHNTIMIKPDHGSMIIKNHMDFGWKNSNLSKHFEIFLEFKESAQVDLEGVKYEENLHNLIKLSPSYAKKILESKSFHLSHVKNVNHIKLMNNISFELEKAIMNRNIKKLEETFLSSEIDEDILSNQNPWVISFVNLGEKNENAMTPSPKKAKKKDRDISKSEIKKWKEDLSLLYSGKLSVPKLNLNDMSNEKKISNEIPSGGPPLPPPPPTGGPNGAPSGPPMPPGPPPPPGPSSKFGSKKTKEEDNGLKKLHWETIPGIKVKESGLWAKVAEKWGENSSPIIDAEIDKNLLESLFQSKPTAKIMSPRMNTLEKGTNGIEEMPQIIDSSKSRNIEILLSSFRRLNDPKVFISLINSIETDNIEKNEISAMEQCIPDENEIELFKEFKGDIKKLSSVDFLLFNLSKEKRLLDKNKTLLYSKILTENAIDIKNMIKIRMEASIQLRESEKFHKLLELILLIGNTLNKGKKFGNAKGFKLDILSTLVSTKSSDGTISLLDYLISIIDEKNTNIRDFYEELNSISQASKISFDDIKLQFEEYKKIEIHLKKELKHYEKFPSSIEYFEKLKNKYDLSNEIVQNVENSINEMKRDYEETINYYGDNLKRKDNEIFKILSDFINEFKKSYSNLLKKKDVILTSPRSARLSHSQSEANLLSPRSKKNTKQKRLSARINIKNNDDDQIIE